MPAAAILMACVLPIAVLFVRDNTALAHTKFSRQSKPVVVRELNVDGGPGVPRTLPALWSAATVIVEGTVAGEIPADVVMESGQDEPPATLVMTKYRVRIDEVFKYAGNGQRLSDAVSVVLFGGDRDRGSYVESFVTDTTPNPVVGQRYIWFLTQSEHGPDCVLATGTSASAMLLQDNRLITKSRAAVADAMVRLGPDGLRNELRRLKGTDR